MVNRMDKYPRTYHLPWSPGSTTDDKKMVSVDLFSGQRVVITEKMDGENTTLTREKTYARSPDSRNHISREWIKNFWSKIAYLIPKNIRVCGENMYAKHSIHYNDLLNYFLGFSVWHNDLCLSWKETACLFNLLGIESVPILYRGMYNQKVIDKLSGYKEGYVIRLEDSFHRNIFKNVVGKYVRKNHVQTDKHWRHQKIVKNILIEGQSQRPAT